ncbi:terminase small subunit [Neptunomonas phycophila]|uniref:terminase small subunit n=1 Tax=Neptunomonas phycophila TaxID=1572645 RepID=UPI003734E153
MKINPTATGQRVNKKQLAEIFGISERTFTEYQRDPQFPILQDGERGESNEYDTAQVLRYLLMISDTRSNRNEQSDLAKAKTEEARANAAMKMLQLNEKLGVLIQKDEASKLITDWARYANRQYRQSFDRFIEEINSQFEFNVPPELRERHATIAAERVRDYAHKLAGTGDGSLGDIQPTEEAEH